MRNQKYISVATLMITAALLAGCSGKQQVQTAETKGAGENLSTENTETQTEIHTETEEKNNAHYPVSETDTETIYADSEDNRELAQFLASYYGISDEDGKETRYYYDCIDLNEDGTKETIAVVVGESTACEGGDPALVLGHDGNGYFVLESFAYVRTPVFVSDEMTNGWHDLIFPAYGGEEGVGYRIFRYSSDGGYQVNGAEFVEDFDQTFVGKKIIANNFIDDMDKGNYLTLN